MVRLILALTFLVSYPLEAIEKIPYRPQWVTVVKKGKLFKYKRKEFSSPRIFQDRIYVGADGGFLYAMKTKNGKKLWRFKTTGPVNSAPAFREGPDGLTVFFGDDEGILYALSAQEGKEIWRAQFKSEILTAPAVSGGRLYVTTVEGEVASVNAEDGKIVWQRERPVEPLKLTVRGNSPPVLEEGSNRLFVGYADGMLQALSASDGRLLWEKSFGRKGRFDDIDGAPMVDADRLYVATFDGSLLALSNKNGNLLWSQEIGSAVRMIAKDDILYVSGSEGYLYALNKRDGSKIWESKIGKGALTAPVLYKDILAVGLSEETMNFVHSGDGHVIARRFAKKGIYSDPIVEGNHIYYLSNGGRLYSLRFVDK